MPSYEYKCPVATCDYTTTSETRTNRLQEACPRCNYSPLHRVFGFAHKPAMQEHFNNTVGKPVSSMRQFNDELKRKSDEATKYTGMEHRYAPLEYGDAAAFGATNEGIHESNVERSRLGMPLLPEVK